jgi:hypothetical protein
LQGGGVAQEKGDDSRGYAVHFRGANFASVLADVIITVVTDDKARLIRAIHERAGEKQTAMEVSAPEASKTKSLGAGLG